MDKDSFKQLDTLPQRILCVKFGYNWLSSNFEDESVKSQQTDEQAVTDNSDQKS